MLTSIYVEMLKTFTALAWPILMAILLWRLLPSIRGLLESRGFTLKIAGMEVTVQEATDQIKTQLQDLREQVIVLRKSSGHDTLERAEDAPPAAGVVPITKTVLWVDDRPSNNAIEMSQLQSRGYTVVQARNTESAMAELDRHPVSAVISDMGRAGEGRQAGLKLLKEMRDAGHRQPFIVYTSQSSSDRNDREVRAAGGDGATASPVQLFEWIERHLAGT